MLSTVLTDYRSILILLYKLQRSPSIRLWTGDTQILLRKQSTLSSLNGLKKNVKGGQNGQQSRKKEGILLFVHRPWKNLTDIIILLMMLMIIYQKELVRSLEEFLWLSQKSNAANFLNISNHKKIIVIENFCSIFSKFIYQNYFITKDISFTEN